LTSRTDVKRPLRPLCSPPRSCAGLGLLLLLAGCQEGTSEPQDQPVWPEGTVLVCDGEPITAEEVDPIALALQPLGPRFTLPHLRRLALTNVCLPLAAGRAQTDSSRLGQALKEAMAFYSNVSNGHDGSSLVPEAPTELIEGAQDSLGVPLWVLIQGQEPGEWSEIEELPGRYVVARLLESNDDPQPQRRLYKVEIASFAYVDNSSSLPSAALNASYTFVDPVWELLIPGSWRYHKPEGPDQAD